MFNDASLLVVDDEDVICQGCRRVFSSEGFHVETSTDAREGLSLATQKDYAAILLDIRMPLMDGIQFLQELRKTKPDVPVIVITGYPSTTNAASATSLGAAGYITKPFTPEEIIQAVQRSLEAPEVKRKEPSRIRPQDAPARQPVSRELGFWGESWLQLAPGDTVRVGAMPPRLPSGTVEAVWLPRIDWFVYQGLPLAGVTTTGGVHFTVPAPVSGVVAATNPLLLERPSALQDDPFGDGWIACISATRFREDLAECKSRRVLLANADEASARDQAAQLALLGCQVRIVGGLGEIGPALQEEPNCNVLLMDAVSLGEYGPEMAGRINVAAPATRIVVLASARCEWESAYRKHRIFYYAVEPFADDEIVDIVDAAFRPPAPRGSLVGQPEAGAEPVSRVCITSPTGERVGLLAEGGLLRRDSGLGWELEQKLGDRNCPLEMTVGSTYTIPIAMRQTASTCDRLVILLARDVGRLPASLVREEFAPVSMDKVRKVTTLIVQPALSGGGPVEFDARTTAALAAHIAREMVCG